ncbi:MAG: T9SS type A sorting domain-containing protein [Ferruginibacter sp.]
MKKIITILFVLSMFVSQVNAQLPTYSWAKIFAYGAITGQNGQSDQVNCVDAQGNIYVAGGFFLGTAIIGDTTTMHIQSPYQSGMYIAKFSASGNLLWKKTGTSSKLWAIKISGIGVDSHDNLYVGLTFSDTLYYDGNQFIETAVSANNELASLCISKSSGSFISKKTISIASASYNAKMSVNSSDELVSIYVQTDSLMIKKFNSAGAVTLNKRWYVLNQLLGGLTYTAFEASKDNIFLAGTSLNNFSIGTANFTTAIGQYWAIRFNNAGAVTWSGQGKSSGAVASGLNSISEDANGNFYTTGHFSGTGSFTGTTQTLFGAEELFYAKYNSAGNLVWLKQSNSQGTIGGKRIRLGTDNKLYMMGVLGSQAMYLGGDSALAVTVISSTNRCFFAQMDTSGNTHWLKRANDAGGIMEAWNALSNVEMYLDSSNNIYFTGSYDFLKNMVLGTFTLPVISNPSNKFFFAKTSVAAIPTGIVKYPTIDTQGISVYPNPTSGKICIYSLEKLTAIEVYNTLGNRIYQSKLTNSKSEIDLSNQANGIYFMKIYIGQSFVIKQIIKE